MTQKRGGREWVGRRRVGKRVYKMGVEKGRGEEGDETEAGVKKREKKER